MAKRISIKLSPWPTLALCCVGLALPTPAHAEASAGQKAAAESLFDDALKAMKSGHHAEACPKLEESERIDPGIGTLLYLGECYEKTGRTASAWATFRQAASSAQAQGETERARVAAARADRLQAGLSKLTIRVAPEAAQLSSLRVTRDNVALANTLFGVAIPVDPGKYHIVASADGYEPFEADLEILPNADSKSLDIPALKAEPRAAPVAGAVPAGGAASGGVGTTPPSHGNEPLRESTAPNGLRTAAYVTGALGVVGLGVGSYFGVKAISKNSDAESHCPNSPRCNDAQGVSLTRDAQSAAVVANVAMSVGAAFVVAGVVLYLSSDHREKPQARLELHPLVSRDLAGIGLGGAFQ